MSKMNASDVTDADMALFSDMYKECYNVRPRFKPTKQDYADLANRYDELQAENERVQRAWLDREGEQAGREFKTASEYYNWYQEQLQRQYDEKQAEKTAAEEVRKPGIKNVIDQWEHGEM